MLPVGTRILVKSASELMKGNDSSSNRYDPKLGQVNVLEVVFHLHEVLTDSRGWGSLSCCPLETQADKDHLQHEASVPNCKTTAYESEACIRITATALGQEPD